MKLSVAAIMGSLVAMALAAPMPADTSPVFRDFETFDPKEAESLMPAGLAGSLVDDTCLKCVAWYHVCIEDNRRYYDVYEMCPNRTCNFKQVCIRFAERL